MIHTDNVMVIGDSWASAVEADSELKYGGWPSMLGLKEGHKCAIPGSTCREWFTNQDHRLSQALEVAQSGEIDLAIVSMMADNFKEMDSGKFDASMFIMKTAQATEQLAQIVTVLRAVGIHVMTLYYANPFPRNEQAAEIIQLLNDAIKLGSQMSFGIADAIRGAEDSAFDGKDIHLTRAGHQMVAHALRKVLDLMPGRHEIGDTVGGISVA